jgi:hypothetical protein
MVQASKRNRCFSEPLAESLGKQIDDSAELAGAGARVDHCHWVRNDYVAELWESLFCRQTMSTSSTSLSKGGLL